MYQGGWPGRHLNRLKQFSSHHNIPPGNFAILIEVEEIAELVRLIRSPFVHEKRLSNGSNTGTNSAVTFSRDNPSKEINLRLPKPNTLKSIPKP